MLDDNHATRSRDSAALWIIGGGLAAGAIIAGFASYLHTLAVAEHADGYTVVAFCVPVLADLTIATSSANMLDAWRHRELGKRFPWLSLASLIVCAAATLGANQAAGDPAQVPTWLVNVWPPIVFMMLLESFLDFMRRRGLRHAKRTTDAGIPCPHEIGMNRDDAVRVAFEHARDCLGEAVTYTALGAGFGVDRGTVRKLVSAELPARDVTPPSSGERPPDAPGVPGGPGLNGKAASHA